MVNNQMNVQIIVTIESSAVRMPNKEARKDFIDFLLSEVEPVYWREILKETI